MLQYDDDTRDACLEAVTRMLGGAPTLELRSGDPAPRCASPAAGDLLASGRLPIGWIRRTGPGVMEKQGDWVAKGVAEGAVGHYRLLDFDGRCREQGRVTRVGGGGEMELSKLDLLVGQAVRVTKYRKTMGAA